jgi:phage terminase small subunit
MRSYWEKRVYFGVPTLMASKSGNPHGLSDQQLVFCREYARSLNATESYKRAGYKWTTDGAARSNAARLIANDNIRAYLGEVLNLSEISVTNEILKTAFANITDVMRWDANGAHLIPSEELSDRGKAAIKSVRIRTKTVTRNVIPEREPLGSETSSAPASEVELVEVTTIESEITLHDKLGALEKLARKLRLYPKDSSVLDAIATLADKGLLLPEQARVVKDGLCGIEEELRSLS